MAANAEVEGPLGRVAEQRSLSNDLLGDSGPHKPGNGIQLAEWRGTTKTSTEVVIVLETADGVIRYALPIEDAEAMAETLDHFVTLLKCHSANSSGIENSDGSPQEGQNV